MSRKPARAQGRSAARAPARAPEATPAFAQNLKAARERVGLSQEALARKAEVGVMHISKMERGALPDPRISTVAKLAQALGVTTDSLIIG